MAPDGKQYGGGSLDAERRRRDDEDRGKLMAMLESMRAELASHDSDLRKVNDALSEMKGEASAARASLARIEAHMVGMTYAELVEFRRIAVEFPWVRKLIVVFVGLILLLFWDALKERIWPEVPRAPSQVQVPNQ